MGPDALGAAASDVAVRHGGAMQITVGDDLMSRGYPLIHVTWAAALSPNARS